jgi:putative aldouronate transport system substrate-binding protein
MNVEPSRRSLLNGAAALAGAAALSPLLAACGGGGSGNQGGTSSEQGLASALPDHVPSDAVTPDIAPVEGAAGAISPPGFLRYPTERVRTVPEVPGSGGTYTTLTPLWGAVPPADNEHYRAMNEALGATLEIAPSAGANYGTVLPTLTAAERLPDWVQLPGWLNAQANTGRLVGTQLADLTPYLAGDRIRQYPNLAALPTGAWQGGIWQDKLYGIPVHSGTFTLGGMFYYRRDIFEERGIDANEVRSADDLFALGEELTDARAGVWAFEELWPFIDLIFPIEAKFRVVDGRLVHRYEQPEFIEALDWCRRVVDAGLLHPDALTGSHNDDASKSRFYAGQSLITADGGGSWNGADADAGRAANPDYRRGCFMPFSADGTSEPRLPLMWTASWYSYLNIKLRPEQIEECLRIANYLAAPYGSQEYTRITFGVEGTHWTEGPDGPQYTEQGTIEAQPGTYVFLANPIAVVSNLGYPQITEDFCAWAAEAVRYAYKPVFWNMNITVPRRLATADAAQAVEDTIREVSRGIQPVSAFQEALGTWKRNGGDELVGWYETEVLDKLGTGQE